MPKTFVIMGVSGCGKSFIGEKLALAVGGFFENNDSPENTRCHSHRY
jgi:gluconate kinase